MRLTETTPFLPMRLLEHPGHPDQKVHGRRGSAPHPSLQGKARATFVRGVRRLVDFHTREAKRLGDAYGWTGRTVADVRAEIGGLMGGGSPERGFMDFALWADHSRMATVLGRQVAALGASV